MRTTTSVLASLLAVAALALPACSKDEDKAADPGPDKPVTDEQPKTQGDELDPAKLAEQVGVEPGGWEVEGPPAAVVEGEGTISVRRTGEETFAAATGKTELHAGDQVRTGTESKAVVTFSDGTVAELAEDSVIAVGDRNAGPDPASSAAVLYGVARFSVAARAPGEGAFMVYTPGGVVGTKGTVFGVGVSVSGHARVGVEEGEVEVAGLADLENPVAIRGAHRVEIAPAGAVAEPAPFENDDWGAWRDEAEADVDPKVVVVDHRTRLEAIEPEIEASYDVLAGLEGEVQAAEEEAAEFEAANNSAGYRNAAPKYGATVEASFLASLRLQHLTYAALAHAYLAQEVYLRHPEKVEVEFAPARPRAHAAILRHKKYHGAVHLHVRPLRASYYRHHPRGRTVAAELKVEQPKFYRAKLQPLPVDRVRARAKVRVYRPPVIVKVDHRKKIKVDGPQAEWHTKIAVKPRDHRTPTGWYVRPKARKARVLAGVKVKRERNPVFRVSAKRPKRGEVTVRWGAGTRVRATRPGVEVRRQGGVKVDVNGKVDTKVRVGPKGGAGVRVHKDGKSRDVRVGPRGGVKVKTTRPGGGVKVKAVRPGAKGGAEVKTPGVKVKAVRPKVKAGVKVEAGAGAKVKTKRPAGKARTKVKAGGGVKVKVGGKKDR